MTIRPFYEPHVLKMSLEKYADIAIDGGLWLVGELLAQGCPTDHNFVPDPSRIYRPRHLETALTELCRINEKLRHRIFVAGFLKLPENGAQATFQRLLLTHNEMLNEAFRTEWMRRCGKMLDVNRARRPAATGTIELLHKLAQPR
jgi:hypothetical protein